MHRTPVTAEGSTGSMPARPAGRRPATVSLAALALLAAGLLAACTVGASPEPSATPAPSPSPPGSAAASPPATPTPAEPVSLRVGLGYIPSIQFAQFYLAQQAGYYRDAGLDVTFENKIDPELITLVASGTFDLGMADGTSLIPAVSQGIPVRYIATVYARFPNIVFAKESSGITSAADLAGRSIGIPGKFGSSWVMLQALLASAGLTPDDADVVTYPDFGQGVAVQEGAVDAATGFVNNEPVQLELRGEPAVVLRVDDAVPLPGNGLIVGADAAAAKEEAIRAFVAATLRAMEDIIADPQLGVDATFAVVPELAADPATQRAILDATIETWQSPYTEANGSGAIDRDGWSASIEFMSGLEGGSYVPNPVSTDDIVSEAFLPPR